MRNTLLMILACLLIGCATKPNKLENECVYTPEKTTFTFWSSVAEKMEVRLYNTYDASDYITKILNRVTFIGAICLSVVAVFPLLVNIISGNNLQALAFGGSSVIIVVGVALETVKALEAQMLMRHYKGFLD